MAIILYKTFVTNGNDHETPKDETFPNLLQLYLRKSHKLPAKHFSTAIKLYCIQLFEHITASSEICKLLVIYFSPSKIQGVLRKIITVGADVMW